VSEFTLPIPLRHRTDPAWAATALADPEGLLSDHAHCEKKAALTAISLINSHPGHPRLVLLLARLAEEELNHFRRVLEALPRFGMALRPDGGNAYAQGLIAFAKGNRRHDQHLLDRLLISALIEARSCERLHLLEGEAHGHPALVHAAWPDFLFELERCEAGHASVYMNLAEDLFPGDCGPRMALFLDHEAELIQSLPWLAAIH